MKSFKNYILEFNAGIEVKNKLSRFKKFIEKQNPDSSAKLRFIANVLYPEYSDNYPQKKFLKTFDPTKHNIDEYESELQDPDSPTGLIEDILNDIVVSVSKNVDRTPTDKYTSLLIDSILKDKSLSLKRLIEKRYIISNMNYRYKDQSFLTMSDIIDAHNYLSSKNNLPKEYKDFRKVLELFENGDEDDFIISLVKLYRSSVISDEEKNVDSMKDAVFNNEDVIIFTPSSYFSARKLGRSKIEGGKLVTDTVFAKWCTSADSEQGKNSFCQYTYSDNKIYILIPKKQKYPGEKYQISLINDEYRDENNDSIDLDTLINVRFNTKDFLNFWKGELEKDEIFVDTKMYHNVYPISD